MTTTNDLTFGLEFECYLPTGASMRTGADAVAARISKPCQVISYGSAHQACPDWKVVTDGSLQDYSRGAEFVSPVLRGDDAISEVEAVCDALDDFGATANDRRCGLHVHIGVAGQPLEFFKRLVRLYQAYETVIDGFMPASRRNSNNGFCRSLGAVSATAISQASSVPELAETIRRATGAMEARYHKLNVAAYTRHRTVEFRQHSGTTNGRKTRMWVSICKKMVLTAMGTTPLGSVVDQPMNQARRGSKAWQIGEMLLRPQGASGPEICQAMGWPSVSVPAQARAAGLDVFAVRTGRRVQYHVRRAASQTPSTLDISLNGFCNLIGLTDDESNYLITRTANLRGAVAWAA